MKKRINKVKNWVWMFGNNIFDFNKTDMKEEDLAKTGNIKYKIIYDIITYIFFFSVSITAFSKYLMGINIFDDIYIIIFISFFIFIIFNLNGLYVILKYYRK